MSWDTGYIQDWSSEGALKFAPALYVGLDLGRALEERLNVLGRSITDLSFFGSFIEDLTLSGTFFQHHLKGRESIVIGKQPPIHDREGDSINLVSFGLLKTIDDLLIGGLCRDGTVISGQNENPVTDFVNYFDNDGIWNKTTIRAPRFRRNDILNYLGQDDFIRFSTHEDKYRRNLNEISLYFSPLLASWARQCYRILNLLRWTDVTWGDTNNPGGDRIVVIEGEGNTYEEAVEAYNNATPFFTFTLFEGDLIYSGTNARPGKYLVQRAYMSDIGRDPSNTAPKNHTYTVKTTNFNYDADLYVWPYKVHDFFYNDKRGWLKDQYNKLGTYEDQNGTKLFDFRDFDPIDAPAKVVPGNSSMGWKIDQRQLDPDKVSYSVLKWNVQNGFKYISDDDNDYVT